MIVLSGGGNYFFSNFLARIASPFFFICSGFFAFRKINIESFKLKDITSYLIRLIILYVTWSLIYFPFTIKEMLDKGYNVIQIVLECINCFFVKGSYFHLWFFPALIYSIVFISLCIKIKLPKKIIILIGIILYLLGLFNQSYYGFIEPLEKYGFFNNFHNLFINFFGSSRNFIFNSLIFVSIGACLNDKSIFNFKLSFTLFVTSMILLFVEVYTLEYFNMILNHDMYLFLIPSSIFLFTTIASININKNRKIFRTMRSLSTIIFLVHNAIIVFLGIVFANYPIVNNIPLVLYFLTVLMAVIGGVFIIWLQKHKYFQWLKFTY